MSALWFLLAILTISVVIAISVWKIRHQAKITRIRASGEAKGYKKEQIDAILVDEKFPLPNFVRPTFIGLSVVFFMLSLFNQVFFYAEPGYKYHVRTIFGEERVIDDVGYAYHLFGRVNAWKKAMTVQSSFLSQAGADADISAESEETSGTSAQLPPQTVIMLDQVDSRVAATVRFRLPDDKETFLKLAHEYRTPSNLLRAALIPAFQETLQANGQLMGAEEFYSGGRTEFNAEFDNQMQHGVFLVKRHEVVVEEDIAADGTATAAANLGTSQLAYGDKKRIRFQVEKILNSDGQPLRKRQKFIDFGISVVEARITDLVPNNKFIERMQLKQQAAADRAIAREKRVQEEEQKLLAIAKGEREIAERQAIAKQEQIQKTTDADTQKQLTIIEANKNKEQAAIDKQTAQIRKEQADIDAQRIKVLADAEAYQKKAIINADNALAQKLEAEIKIQEVWAEAYARRNVPTNVFGANGNVPSGSDTEVKNFLQLMTLDAAKRLNYDRGVGRDAIVPQQPTRGDRVAQ